MYSSRQAKKVKSKQNNIDRFSDAALNKTVAHYDQNIPMLMQGLSASLFRRLPVFL